MADKDKVLEALKEVIDPELFIDVVTLGLIYEVESSDAGVVDIRMTFTSVACPAGPQLVEQVRSKAMEVEGVQEANVQVVFEPPWEPSEELKAMMGIG